jgi:H+-translocating NAD(P) transhydrogenase subunit alpha
MPVVVGVLKETAANETRVALTPEIATKLKGLGARVLLERGAGVPAHFADAAYRDAELSDASTIVSSSDVILSVQPLSLDTINALKEGAVAIGYMQAYARADLVRALKARRLTSFAMELVPRISRAQSMDALSSQAAVAGYKAALIAANALEKFMPMLTTAAGTIRPAAVLVIGAGVAGLQAIATAKRLGAVVEAYDVRPAVKEEVHSLGATFLELELESQEGSGGYAGAQSEEFLSKQRELLTARVAAADVVVTTAAIPGRRSPILVTGEMVEGMRRGSVLVDLASEGGGNCELTRPGEVIETDGGVSVDGTTNLPSLVPVHASQLYARNVATFIQSLIKDGELVLDFDDQVTRDTCLAHDGQWVSERGKQLLGVASL